MDETSIQKITYEPSTRLHGNSENSTDEVQKLHSQRSYDSSHGGLGSDKKYAGMDSLAEILQDQERKDEKREKRLSARLKSPLNRTKSPSQLLKANVKKEPTNCLAAWVTSKEFEATFAFLIMLNAVTLAIEAEHIGRATNSRTELKIHDDAFWPDGDMIFLILDNVFGSVFLLEIILKLVGLRSKFIQEFWNWYDLFIVSMWLLILLGYVTIGTNPLIFRLARIARIFRLLRFVRTFHVFDVLHVIVGSIKASKNVLLWSTVLLFLIMASVTLVINASLEDYVFTLLLYTTSFFFYF
jgi:hypothetical protein